MLPSNALNKLKDPHIRTEAQNKKYKNFRSTLFKRSEQSYFTNFFQENSKDLKNICKGIKTFHLKVQTTHNAIYDSNATLVDPIAIANAFNKYFSIVVLDIQFSIRYSNSFHQSEIHFFFHLPIVIIFLASFLY